MIYYHGLPRTENRFKYHVSTPKASDEWLSWHPILDTTLKPREFCNNCKFIRKEGNGREVWECLGHDKKDDEKLPELPVFDIEPELAVPLPEEQVRDEALRARQLWETFSGDPKRGGESLSNAWIARGGKAHCRDTLRSPNHDFLKDQKFWDEQFKAVSYTHLRAHET